MWFEERSWSNLKMNELVEERRDLWAFKIDFLVAGCSYVFATTNLLNLPKLILENGGLAFISAYGAILLLCVLPIIIMELAAGQLTGRAPVLAFYNLCPIFKGIGVSQILLSILVLSCMTRFLGWLLLYTFHLFWTIQADRPGLPWLNCRNFPEFVTTPCRETGSIGNFTHDMHTKLNTIEKESSLMQFMSSLERPTESIDQFGDFRLYFLIAHGAIWVTVFCFICFGVRWLGKIIPFTFMASFSMILALLIRALTMDGLETVFDVYWKATDWERLMDYQVWKIAVEQALLASGVGFGAFITMGSYNKRSNNLVGDSLCIVICHAVLSLMQVLIVVGLVGFVSVKTGLQFSDLLEKGESQLWHLLAYFSYLPNIKLWTGLLLLASVFILFNIFSLLSLSVLSTLEDAMGERWSRCFPRFVLSIFVCGLVMSCSLYFTTQAGRHAYELCTGFLKYVTLWAILAAELFAIAWCYCAHRLGTDLRTMLRTSCCWCLGHFFLYFTYLLPVVPAGIAVLNTMSYSFDVYSPSIHHWPYSEYVGWAIAILPLLPIPLYALGAMCSACCCGSSHESKAARCKAAVRSRVRRTESEKFYSSQQGTASVPPRYSTAAPGYLLLPQAPLAEPEAFAEAR